MQGADGIALWESTGLSLAYDRHQLPAERFHAHDGHAFDVGHTAIDHLDAVDGTFPASEIHRTRAFALPDDGANRDVIRLAVGINHFEVQHLHIGVAYMQ